MDLLGSIMGSMTAPPGMSQQEKDKKKKMREMQKKVIDSFLCTAELIEASFREKFIMYG